MFFALLCFVFLLSFCFVCTGPCVLTSTSSHAVRSSSNRLLWLLASTARRSRTPPRVRRVSGLFFEFIASRTALVSWVCCWRGAWQSCGEQIGDDAGCNDLIMFDRRDPTRLRDHHSVFRLLPCLTPLSSLSFHSVQGPRLRPARALQEQ